MVVFYNGDSLCTYTKEAFIMAFPELVFPTSDDFVQFFKKIGCYLDDLSLIPVNDRNTDERKRMQLEGMPGLVERIADYQPNAIVCMLKDRLVIIMIYYSSDITCKICRRAAKSLQRITNKNQRAWWY